MQAQNQLTFTCFKIKFYEGWDSKLCQKIELFVPSTGRQNCLDKSLILQHNYMGLLVTLALLLKNLCYCDFFLFMASFILVI